MPKYNFISHGGSENVEHDKSEWQEELSVQMTTLMQVVIPWSPDFLIPPKYLSLITKWNHEWNYFQQCKNCLRFQVGKWLKDRFGKKTYSQICILI